METKKKIGSKKFLRIVNILLIFAILIVGAGVTILANLEILIFASIWMFGIPLLIFFAFLGLLLGNFRLSNYKLKMLVFYLILNSLSFLTILGYQPLMSMDGANGVPYQYPIYTRPSALIGMGVIIVINMYFIRERNAEEESRRGGADL